MLWEVLRWKKVKFILIVCVVLFLIFWLDDAIRGFKDGFMSGNPF